MAGLTFTFIGNACGIFTGSKGTRILCDPWVVDGVFDGSWCHYPPLATKPEELHDVDAVYISHLHPDHFDERHFGFSRDMPLIVLNHEPNFLEKKLRALGFRNFIAIRNEETIKWNEFELTCFSPFSSHVFHEAEVGNLIDSAIAVSDGGHVALNTNDNTPTTAWAERLREMFGRIDLVMLNYNAAGPYPSCFDNLTRQKKISEHHRILKRNFRHLVACLNAMRPKAFLPFAGAYVLGGKERHKNEYLGTTTWDECAAYVRSHIKNIDVVTLRERDEYSFEAGCSDRAYVPIDVKHMKRFIKEDLGNVAYPYESDMWPPEEELLASLKAAAGKMRERMNRYGIHPKKTVYLYVFGCCYQIFPQFSHVRGKLTGNRLECRLDERLLARILDRRSSWNNAEIGAHINFYRTPNDYEPDLHTGLQFLHL